MNVTIPLGAAATVYVPDERRFLDQRRRQAGLAGPRREALAGAGGGRFSRPGGNYRLESAFYPPRKQ